MGTMQDYQRVRPLSHMRVQVNLFIAYEAFANTGLMLP